MMHEREKELQGCGDAPVSSHLIIYFVRSFPNSSVDPSCNCTGFWADTFLPSSVVPFVCDRRTQCG